MANRNNEKFSDILTRFEIQSGRMRDRCTTETINARNAAWDEIINYVEALEKTISTLSRKKDKNESY